MTGMATEIDPDEALALRMRSLLLAGEAGPDGGPPKDVAGVVTWFGAMQAQDLASGLWSLGARLPGRTAADVQAALERREALRTWPMRGTVHLVPPRDARWMLELTGSIALAGAARRRAFIGLSERDADRAVEVLGAALAGGGRLTRSQCLTALAEAGIDSAGQLGYHLLWYASQRGVTCIAPNVGAEQTFVLLDEWVPDPHRPERDEALATLARRYFRSHGPSTRRDFAGWTGLGMADARRGIAAADDTLATVLVDGVEMHLDPARLDGDRAGRDRAGRRRADVLPGGVAAAAPELLALAGFDEYLLGFKDRSLMLADEHKRAIVPGGNGVFQWTIVRAGRVVGTWRRTVGKTRITIEVHPLVRLGERDRARVEDALRPYASFVGLPLVTRWAAA